MCEMKNVAKGDVEKLCQHTRELLYELDAAGEVTNDLLANLIEALKEAPDSNFQRWLSNQVDLWSYRWAVAARNSTGRPYSVSPDYEKIASPENCPVSQP